MRILVRWAVMLYPAAWRARYGGELEALMEDTGVRGGDVWDLVRGAMFMQMTSLNFGKIVAGFTLAGVLAAGVWAVAQPRQYVSTAVLRMSPAKAPVGEADNLWRMQERSQRLQRLQQNALSRKSLAEIIQAQHLFREDRKKRAFEHVIQDMRNANIRIKVLDEKGGTTFAVNYTSTDPAEAQAAARAIVEALIEQNLVQAPAAGEGPANLEVIDPASLPSVPSSGNRTAVMGRLVGLGLALGLGCGALRWAARRSKVSLKRIGGFAAAGMTAGVVIAFMIPNEYISTAVLRSAEGAKVQTTITQVLSDESVAAMIRKDDLFTEEVKRDGMDAVVRQVKTERIRVQSLDVNGITAYVVSFRYRDRFAAQRMTQRLVMQFTGQTKTEVLDPASDPMRPSSPNRMQIAGLGTVLGILLGLMASRLRRDIPLPA